MPAKRINRSKARDKYRARYGYAPSSDSVLDSFINTLSAYDVSSISDSSSYGDSSSCYSDSGSSYTDTSSCSFD